MGTSRSQLDRLLDPTNVALSLGTFSVKSVTSSFQKSPKPNQQLNQICAKSCPSTMPFLNQARPSKPTPRKGTNMTDSQLRANQANAQHSTGPRTDEGKARARYNARRHGLTGQFYVMDDDDRQAYLTFETRLMTDLKPAVPYEDQLAVSIAQDHWRMNRAKGIEFNTMGLGHHDQAELFLANEFSKNQVVTEENIEVNGAQQCGLIPTSLEGKENIEVNGAQQCGLIPTSLEGKENIQVNGFVFSIKTVGQ